MKDWNPELYLHFANERTRPAQELVARIAYPNPNTVSDLGCGPGNSTELLTQAWPHATVTGVDSSSAMLAQAPAATTVCASGYRYLAARTTTGCDLCQRLVAMGAGAHTTVSAPGTAVGPRRHAGGADVG